MAGDLANAYMQQFKAQMGFIEQSNQVPNEIPKNVQYQEPHRVEQPMPAAYPLPPSGRINHGCCSDVLPALHSHDFGKSAIHFNGSTLHISERRGSAIHFHTGTAVRVENIRDFGARGHDLPGRMPDFKKKILRK